MLRIALLSLATALFPVAASAFPILTPKPTTTVFEYYNVQLDHYFLTATLAEMDAIDHGSAGPGWVRTGWSFEAYEPHATTAGFVGCVDGPDCGVPVARFYGTPGLGPNSHFYTADPGEAAGLKVPGSGWTFERDEFNIAVPNGTNGAGACPSGHVPVYRLYNNGFARHIDVNHRYVTDAGERAKMQAKGWIDEGVRFCAYGASLGPIKSYLMATTLDGKVRPGPQCEDETLNRGACIGANNLPAPATRYAPYVGKPWSDIVPTPFAELTGMTSNYVFVADAASATPWSTNFVQADGLASFAIHIDSTKRAAGDLSSINPVYQFHTTVDPGTFDDRFFPWAGYESDTELRIAFTLNVKTINITPGSAAYGHPTLEFIDTKSGHHLYFTVETYESMPVDNSDFLSVDGSTGKVIVGTTFRASSPYLRSLGLPTLPTPGGFVSPNPWGWGGAFEFRMNRDEFLRVLADGRKLDAALSASPDDYILDNFHFNNEVYKDGEIGVNLANYTLQVLKR